MKERYANEQTLDKLQEECGIFGVYDTAKNDVANMVYYGLFALQHRGQESCGIAVSNDREVSAYKDMGLVNEVFNPKILDEKIHGDMAIGHVRYSSAKSCKWENAMPLVTKYIKGTLAIAHNGTLTNTENIRRDFERTGAIFQTTIDAELIAYLIARQRVESGSVEEAVARALPKITGSYALLVMSPRKIIAARDPFGLKPLCIGKIDNTYVIASESCALDTIGAKFIRDVIPGEIVIISESGLKSDKRLVMEKEKQGACIFEYIYYARPDSKIDGMSVYRSREIAGELLAKQYPVEADIVVGVPESGIDAAIGYSQQSGIPYAKAFVKNNYIGRTFIKPKQSQRVEAVKIKLNSLSHVVEGKRVVMIDDSIVRGTTSVSIVKMLKTAGATEVHVRISSPLFKYMCPFGTDVPSSQDLIANQLSVQEICEKLGADSLGFLNVDSLDKVAGNIPFCNGCFTGVYPGDVDPV